MAKKSGESTETYVVYILRCADGTFYTGVTTDLNRRVKEHNTETVGAKYTKARRPVQPVYSEPAANRSEAQQREYVLRRLSRSQKLALVDGKKT